MKTSTFSAEINAPKEKVWQTLWNEETYRQWTSVFMAGSYAVSDWQEGGKVLFLAAQGDGMYSLIDRKIDNELMSFRHLGVVKGGIEQPADEETKKWAGARETYELKENNEKTLLHV